MNELDNRYLSIYYVLGRDSQVALVVKSLPANAGDLRDLGSISGLGQVDNLLAFTHRILLMLLYFMSD